MLRAEIYLTMEDDRAADAIDALLVELELEEYEGTLSSSVEPLRNLAGDKASVDDMVHLKNVFPSLAKHAAADNPSLEDPILLAAAEVARVLGSGNITLSRMTMNMLEKFGMKRKGDD